MSLRIPELTPERGRMAALIESGRVADLILAIMVLEAAVLCALAMRRPAREPVAGLLLNLGAGASLVLALRASITGADWAVVGAWLAVALLAHAGDLIERLRRSD